MPEIVGLEIKIQYAAPDINKVTSHAGTHQFHLKATEKENLETIAYLLDLCRRIGQDGSINFAPSGFSETGSYVDIAEDSRIQRVSIQNAEDLLAVAKKFGIGLNKYGRYRPT